MVSCSAKLALICASCLAVRSVTSTLAEPLVALDFSSLSPLRQGCFRTLRSGILPFTTKSTRQREVMLLNVFSELITGQLDLIKIRFVKAELRRIRVGRVRCA